MNIIAIRRGRCEPGTDAPRERNPRGDQSMHPEFEVFSHEPTFTFSYVMSDPESGKCVIIDPVLDFDPRLNGDRSIFPLDGTRPKGK